MGKTCDLMLHIAACELDEVGADRVADAAAARVQHHPGALRFVETDLDEMIAAAERAHLLHPIERTREALRELRMRRKYLFETALQRRGCVSQCIPLFVLVPPHRHIA